MKRLMPWDPWSPYNPWMRYFRHLVGKPANAFEQRTDEQIQHDRETALFLFRKLTGKDFGYDVEKWIVYFEEHEDEIIEGDETMNGEPL